MKKLLHSLMKYSVVAGGNSYVYVYMINTWFDVYSVKHITYSQKLYMQSYYAQSGREEY